MEREIDNLRTQTQIPLATVLSSLARNAATRTTVALEKGAEADLIALLALVSQSVPPLADYSVWTYLYQILSEPRIITWMKTHPEICHWLLEHWGEISSSFSIEQMLPWLRVEWNELEAFLALKLPDPCYATAIIGLLDASLTPLSLEAQRIIERHAKRFEAILQQLIQVHDWQRATSYFAKLVQSGYSEKMKLLDILLTSENTQSVFLEQVLSSAQLTWDEFLQIIERYGQQLLARPDLPSILVNFIRQYVRNLTVDSLEHLSTRRVLAVIRHSVNTSSFHSQFLSGELQAYLRSWSILADFIHEPTLVPEVLPVVAKAFPRLPEKMQPQVKQRLLQLLTTRVTSPNHLGSVLGTMVPALAPSRVDLLLQMAELERSLQQRPPSILAWYVKEMLEEALKSNQQRKQEMLHNLLGSLLKDAGRDVYEQVDREARTWPKPVQDEWNTYAGEHRPPGKLVSMRINLQRWQALTRAKKALVTRKIAAIGEAYSPVLKDYDQVTLDEYNMLVLAHNWVTACKQDDDGEIVKAYEAIYQHQYEQSFDFTPEEIKRFEFARERWRALANFRKALESKRAQQIVQAYTPVLTNYQHFSQQERECVTLALKFARAYNNTSDNATLIAVYDEIIKSPYHPWLEFTPEEIQRMDQARAQQAVAKSSPSPATHQPLPITRQPPVASGPSSPVTGQPRDRRSQSPSPTGQHSATRGQSPPVTGQPLVGTGQSPIIITVNGYPITENLLIRMCHVKSGDLEYQITQMQEQTTRQPSTERHNQDRINKLKEEIKSEDFLPKMLDELIEDFLIREEVQHGILPLDLNTTLVNMKTQKIKTYIWKHRQGYQLWQDKHVSDADLKDFLFMIERREQFAKYLKMRKIGTIEEWFSEQRKRKQAMIQYAEEYDPSKGRRKQRFSRLRKTMLAERKGG